MTLEGYSDSQLAEEIKRRASLKEKEKGWAKLVMECCYTDAEKSAIIIDNDDEGCRIEWPVEKDVLGGEQYLLSAGGAVKVLVEKLHDSGGFFWMGVKENKVYFIVRAKY